MLFIYKKTLSRTHTESLIGKANYYFEVWNVEGQSLFQTKCLDAKPWKEAEPYLLEKLCCFSGQKSVLLFSSPASCCKARHGEPGGEPGRTLTPKRLLEPASELGALARFVVKPSRTRHKLLSDSHWRQTTSQPPPLPDPPAPLASLRTSNPRQEQQLIQTNSKRDSWRDGNGEGDKAGDKREGDKHQGCSKMCNWNKTYHDRVLPCG